MEHNLAKKLSRALPRYQQIQLSIDWEIAGNPSSNEVRQRASVLPLKDAPILASAVALKPARLITLDKKHFIDLPVAEQSNVIIVTPAQVLMDLRTAISDKFPSPNM